MADGVLLRIGHLRRGARLADRLEAGIVAVAARAARRPASVSGTPRAASSSWIRCMPTAASRVGPSQSAVWRPGWPSSAATLKPESSARAGRPLARVAASALIVAFSSKLLPVSSGTARPRSAAETISTPKPESSVRISPALPRLWVATTSLGQAKRRAIRTCRSPTAASAPARRRPSWPAQAGSGTGSR
jgi:hypothetical protein